MTGQLVFTDKASAAEAMMELRRLILRGDARVTAADVDGTGKLTLRIALPGSETVDRRASKR